MSLEILFLGVITMILKTGMVKEVVLALIPDFYQFWRILLDQIDAQFPAKPASLVQFLK